jgi:hypothetical protein
MRGFWGRMLGRSQRAASPLGALPGTTSTGNPILEALDAAGIPWRATRTELARRYGIRKHPAYGWQDIFIATPRPFARGLLYPLAAHVQPIFSPRLPATEFMGLTSFGNDARHNIRATADELAQRLGETTVAEHYNTIQCQWNFGTSEVKLIAWPPEMQRPTRHKIPAHRKDPRLATACHIEIKTGFRLAPSAEERAWLDSFVAIGPARFENDIAPEYSDTHAPYQGELEFVREPGPERARIFGRVGLSADGQALMFSYAQLYLVPVRRVTRVLVTRVLPGRGPGHSTLCVDCTTDYPDVPMKRPMIGTARGIDDLTDLGHALAAAMKKPCEVGQTWDD